VSPVLEESFVVRYFEKPSWLHPKMMSFGLTTLLVAVTAVIAGAIASVTGFGIGSLLTPLLALHTGTRLAVAAISVPHLAGTALRFWMLRQYVDRRVLWSFGLMSTAGGLAGAFLHTVVGGPGLTAVLGGLLVFAGITGLTGLADRMRFSDWMAWVAGAISGVLGGLVGNQGGIRSAAMLGFNVPKEAFVATATAVALFRRVVSLIILVLGIVMLLTVGRQLLT
jgi:hypothetical protein